MTEHKLAAAIVRDAGGRVLLVQNHWPVGVAWNLPGGRVEPGEDLVQAVARELREETGLALQHATWAYVLDYHDPEQDRHFLWHVFACDATGTAQAPAQDEFVVGVEWTASGDLPGRLWPLYCGPLIDYLRGQCKRYYLRRDAGWGI